MSFFLFFSRSESQAMVRPLFWYSLMPYLLFTIIKKRGRVRWYRSGRRCGVSGSPVAKPSSLPN
jgi:hypothetical protein